jgi:putative acetyltransferase
LAIRRFEEPDLDAILSIYADAKLDELRFEKKHYTFIPLNQDRRRFYELMESDIYVDQREIILAYGALYQSQIRAIYVHSTARRMGAGRAMLEYLLSKTTADVTLNVAKSNAPAKALYRQYGFEVVREFTADYAGIDTVAEKMVLKQG